MDQLLTLEPRDLELLKRTDARQLLGSIIRLNQDRYHNSLNAIVLMGRLLELRLRGDRGGTGK